MTGRDGVMRWIVLGDLVFCGLFFLLFFDS